MESRREGLDQEGGRKRWGKRERERERWKGCESLPEVCSLPRWSQPEKAELYQELHAGFL